MSKILLTTYGSYGDLHPFIAMGKALINVGHKVTLMSHIQYKEIVENFGIHFIPMRPSEEDFGSDDVWPGKAHDPKTGTLYFMKELILPYLNESYELLENEIPKYDLVIPHTFTFAAPLVAEKHNIPWLSCLLQPCAIFSAYDPPFVGKFKYLSYIKFLGPRVLNLICHLMMKDFNKNLKPVVQLKKKLGLENNYKRGAIWDYSKNGILALFPKEFSIEKPDWPKEIYNLGFPLFDQENSNDISSGLRNFIDKGEAPIVFTLGSTIVKTKNDFYINAFKAIKEIGCRAIFLVGKKPQRIPEQAYLSSNIFISNYEPFSVLFPYCSMVVHQCGIGTTGQALAAAKPQILIPFSHDQPDNARRVEKLGIGISIQSQNLTQKNLVQAIKKIKFTLSFAQNAEKFAQNIRQNKFDENLINIINKKLK
ncbi:glycosyltransferase [Fluviispira vulneris]|uniref:glycosyltransferase n=1 Tax=Fluviispira vulneris TaxID=2763012 RepID=UPI001645FBBD|nr:glycosyltransferase [Fluviispira vulneris]